MKGEVVRECSRKESVPDNQPWLGGSTSLGHCINSHSACLSNDTYKDIIKSVCSCWLVLQLLKTA